MGLPVYLWFVSSATGQVCNNRFEAFRCRFGAESGFLMFLLDEVSLIGHVPQSIQNPKSACTTETSAACPKNYVL